jgi:uncharacterized BrkB/YihY/UPF0761 family membrane protein
MKMPLKFRLFALLVAIVTASVMAAATDPLSVPFGKKLGYHVGSALIFGFPIYVAFMLLHYWLCRKLTVQRKATSSLLGALLMVITWLLIAVAQPKPSQFERDFRPMIALLVGGAVYGFASAYLSSNVEPA